MSTPFHKVASIFEEALDVPASERGAFIENACAGDADLLAEVRSLLRHQGRQTAAIQAVVQPVASDLIESMTARMEPAGGAMLGPYHLQRLLGEGGMGAVYLATDTRLRRNVAVKVISNAISRSAEARARFLREARSAAALCHPNIATIYDVGESPDSPWLVMEYVSGVSLRSLMAGPVGARAWLHYASQIAAALGHAHARGILHRDVKPENILITEDDHVKIIDFGLARTSEEGATSAITQADTFLGTLAYAAPELMAGGAASARSDVYSAGVVLYELACGVHPFANLKGHALVSAIAAGSYPTCTSRNVLVGAGAAAIIDRMMARQPAARYKNGTELAAALHDPDAAASERSADPAPLSLAIIDFENIGSPSELNWLGTGIAESLAADLAKVRSVRIVSRSRVVQSLRRLDNAANDPAAVVEIGRELDACWIVTGGYQKIGDRVRVTVKLVDTATGDALAAEKIDGNWSELFEVQDRAAAVALKALTIHIGTTDAQKIMAPETRDIAAYEHYIRARQQMYEMHGRSLSGAIMDFEHAIRLDPDYALAYSGLGTAHALLFIQTSNPEDIQRAYGYLERAIKLDPELGEPYPWLANIRIRKNDPEGARAAGRRGVELQPDLSEAHYFYGGVFYLLPEMQCGGLRTAVQHLVQATRLESRFHAAWLVLGAAVLFLGKHEKAIRILNEAVRKESETDLLYPFVGARTLIAFAHARAGLWQSAHEWHLDSLKALRNSDHIYKSSFETLSACGLGEIELYNGNVSGAFTYFRRARRIIGESRRTVGSVRLLIRIDAGLAAAYASAGETERAQELAGEVWTKIESLAGQTSTATFECSLAQLWLTLACVESRLGDLDAGAACLSRARESGWLDAAWLRIDPELQPLRDHHVFREFVAELDAAPATELPPLGSGGIVGPGSASIST